MRFNGSFAINISATQDSVAAGGAIEVSMAHSP